jgi:DNA polymerase alpha subunit A
VGVQMKKEERDPVIPPLKTTSRPITTNGVKKEEDKPPTWLAVYDSLTVTKEEELGPATKSGAAFDATANKVDIEALEQDGTLRFFWLDYLEHEGKLYFIGKLKDKKSGAWVSCCVTVENLQRNLFVLPRDKKVEEVWEEPEDEEDDDDDDEENEEKPKKKTANRKKILVDTDEVPTEDDVEEDFEQVRKRFGIKRMRAKFVDRKYAFGERDVPRGQHKWMKVVYGFDGMFG